MKDFQIALLTINSSLCSPCLRASVRTSFGKLFIISIFLLLLISCKSTPSLPDTQLLGSSGFPLDSGASVYLFANVKQARPIIDLIPMEELKDRQTKHMLDKTNFLAAAFFPPEKERFIQLAAMGNYPKFWANIGFFFKKNWKKRRTEAGQNYWYSRTNGLSIMLYSNQAYIAASLMEDAPSNPLAVHPYVEIPQGFVDFREEAPLSLWLDNPAPVFSQVLKNSGVPLNFPVQKLFVNLYNAEPKNFQGQYEAMIRMQFENAVQARGMAALLSLAGSFNTEEPLAALFFANPPVVNGGNIDIKTPVLSGDEIALLLEMFLLYLN